MRRLTRPCAPLVLAGTLAVVAAGCATGARPDADPTVARTARAPRPAEAIDGPAELTDLQRRARMHYQVALDHLRGGRSPQAISELLTAERMDPTDAKIQLALAEAYREQGRGAETELHLRRALAIDPQFHQAELNLAAYYIQTERYAEAVPLLQGLLDDPTFPSPWRALTNLGWAEYRLGRLDEAHRSLSLAVDYRPDYWRARLNLGIVESERGNRAEAIAHFQRVLDGQPGPLAEAEVRFRLAEQLVSLGDRQAAVRHLMAASDLEPSGPWSRRSAEFLATLQ